MTAAVLIALGVLLFVVVGGILHYLTPSREETERAKREVIEAYLKYASRPGVTEEERKAALEMLKWRLGK